MPARPLHRLIVRARAVAHHLRHWLVAATRPVASPVATGTVKISCAVWGAEAWGVVRRAGVAAQASAGAPVTTRQVAKRSARVWR